LIGINGHRHNAMSALQKPAVGGERRLDVPQPSRRTVVQNSGDANPRRRNDVTALSQHIAVAAGKGARRHGRATPGPAGKTTGTNDAIVAIFNEIADLLDISGANPFRIRAYRNVVRTVSGLSEDAGAMLARGVDLTALPGIGDDLAGKIREIVESGNCTVLTQLREAVPGQAAALLRLPGLGPRRVQVLQRELHVATLDDLARAAREHRISVLSGFGARSEQRLLEGIQAHLDRNRRFNLEVATHAAEQLLAYLRRETTTQSLDVAGSYRRGKDTVGDLDIVAASASPKDVIRTFVAYPMTQRVISAGTTRASTVLANGIQVDLRVVPAVSFGAALVYLTGSKAHNVAKASGVLVSINSDAHRARDFQTLSFGLARARRGWLQAADVLNARPLPVLRSLLRRTM
jgi:DNA polymerase/3'-5' exonuclease PolX